jgi:hypothetical protein
MDASEREERGMNEKKETHSELGKQLKFCETRLKELKAKPIPDDVGKGLEQLEGELKSCQVELNQMEGKSGDEWVDAKNSVTRRLRDMQSNLNLSARRIQRLVG